MTCVAAVDCGTNSIRLLVAEAAGGGGLRDLHREMRIVRLGQDVDRTGRLASDALARVGAALRDYRAIADRLGAARVRLVATSATRDASNRDEFERLVNDTLGVQPDVVSGTDEAALSFAGATSAVPDAQSPLLVVDIGGGSTELVVGGGADRALSACSMDVGAVRLTERHVRHDPPAADEIAAIEADVRAAIADVRSSGAVGPELAGARTAVGVAGTITTVAALALGLTRYDPDLLEGARLSGDRIAEVTALLVASSAAEREAMPAVHPGRRDVITAGSLVLRTLVAELGLDEIVVSEHDILDGIALGLLDEASR